MKEKPQKVGPLLVWTHKPEGASKGIVLHVHGLGEHSGRHVHTFQALLKAGFTVVRFDLRGSGSSEGPRQWVKSFDDYLDDIDAVVETFPPSTQKIFLFGHSLGGLIALHYAARRKHSFSGLILNAPAFLTGNAVSPLKIWIGKRLEKIIPKLKIPNAIDVLSISRDAAVVKSYQEDPLNCAFNTVRQGNEILRAMDRVLESSKQIRIPTLLTHGTDDRLILPQGSEEILKNLATPDKTLKLIPGGYHELHNDPCKDEYFKEVVDWLLRHLKREKGGAP